MLSLHLTINSYLYQYYFFIIITSVGTYLHHELLSTSRTKPLCHSTPEGKKNRRRYHNSHTNTDLIPSSHTTTHSNHRIYHIPKPRSLIASHKPRTMCLKQPTYPQHRKRYNPNPHPFRATNPQPRPRTPNLVLNPQPHPRTPKSIASRPSASLGASATPQLSTRSP